MPAFSLDFLMGAMGGLPAWSYIIYMDYINMDL